MVLALRTKITELLGIDHPVVLGGLGILSATRLAPAEQRAEVAAIRQRTDRPFGLNHLLCFLNEERFATSLELRPRVVSTAWPWGQQDLASYWDRAHQHGALVIHMVSSVPEEAITNRGRSGGERGVAGGLVLE